MATKKEKAPEEIMDEAAETAKEQHDTDMVQAMKDLKNQIAALQKDLDTQKKENAELKKNSVHSSSPYGGKSDYERVQEACKQADADGADPWGQKISVLAPRIGKGEDSYWLCINGRSIQVPANDRYYELALPFAECLVNEVQARNRASDYIDKIEVFDPKDNPHPVEKIV